jgi:hypothetical protein
MSSATSLLGIYNDFTIAPKMGTSYNLMVRITARSTLREFWEVHAEAEPALRA